jgi:ribosomal protein S18 acetylase RimI-like enzyme
MINRTVEVSTLGKKTQEDILDIEYFGSIEISSTYVSALAKLEALAGYIKGLLKLSSKEFIPPLSFRKGSSGTKSLEVQKDLGDEGIERYFKKMLSQKNIVAINSKGEIVAFMSFIPDYKTDLLQKGIDEKDKINYITTIIVDKAYRRHGVAAKLYAFIEESLPDEIHAQWVATRTWHTNYAHISLLKKRNFELLVTMHQERVYLDEKFDTVYYCKRVEREQKPRFDIG